MQKLIEFIRFYVSPNTTEMTLLQNSIEKTYEKHENIFTQGKLQIEFILLAKGVSAFL